MGISVLVVDDSPTTRFVIEKVARATEDISACHHAADGEEALEVLVDNRVDLVFADLHMPNMDGRELLRRMKEHEVWRGIPVAVVTSEQSESAESEMLELGATFYITKPIAPEMIRDIFEALRKIQ